ncbi:MAG: restriction endonuclease subunit S, partial [Methylococcaceae bacterium]
KQIVALLDQAFTAIDKAQANIETNINNAKELFQSKLNDIFSQGWEERTLGEACVVERGSSPRPIKSFITDSDDGVNWIKIGDVGENDKYVRTTKQKITKEGAEKSRFVDIGDFILSNSMSFGRAYIMAIQGYIHDGWFVLRIPKEINSDYFWQLLSSPYLKNQFNQLAAGAIVKNISGDLVKKAIVPIPPLEKQIQIYEETDLLSKKIEEVVTKYETKLQNLEELKKSILQKAFNGELTNHQPNIIPFPQKVENISTTELHAGLIALAFKQHLEAGSNSFHHVKSEKIIHMLESYVGIDLERVPTQDAAGPNDYPRVKSKIEHRAKMAGYFYVNQTPQGYYQYSKGNNFDALVDKTCDKLGDKLDAVLQMIKIMVELDTKMAEILATVYAAWNNLIIDNKKITDEAIVSAARENWHDDKLNIPRKRFFKAINWMKKEGIVPKGLGKKVEKKET